MKRMWVLFFILIFVFPTVAQDQAPTDTLTHVVQPGENLYRIALRYGVSMDSIIQANNLADPSRIFRGQSLIIPGLSVPEPTATTVENPLVAGTPTAHIVQRGESLTLIANRYGTTVEQILQANNIGNANRIYPGQSLNIWTTESVNQPLENEPVAQEVVPAETLLEPDPAQVNSTYTVQAGETLAAIAGRFGVDWRVVAQMNGIANPNTIYAGQRLTIPALNANGGVIDMGIISNPINVPIPTISVGKQIIVDLSDSMVYAFQDGVLLRSVLVSTGLPATPTVQGDYTIYNRVRSQTMSGPGYYLPNVEWVLYFYQGYALHGTYWHTNWGYPMSHGCVNMPNDEAQWFYDNFGEIGTPVRVIA